jgi:hypothetical protein
VQNGKLAASAWAASTRALKSVDLPTFGSPTIPVLSMKNGLESDPTLAVSLSTQGKR